MRFKQHYFTEIYSTWIYTTDDPYKSIYDFYALSLINTELIRDEDLAYAFKEAKKTIVDYMREFLLEQLERAVSAEIPYYLHFKVLEALKGNYIPQNLKGKEGSIKFYKDYIKEFGDPKKLTSSGKLILVTEPLTYEHLYDEVYQYTKDFMKKYEYSTYDLFNFAKNAFSDESGWRNEQLGGRAWAMIADAGLQVLDLKNDKDANKTFAILDHVFDLEHNTGSIFTKNKDLDVFKIKGILDDKRDITNEVSYYDRISSGLKEPYMAVIKDLTGKTLESERPKIDLEDMLLMIKHDPKRIKYMKTAPIEVQKVAIEIDPTTIALIDQPKVELMKLAIDKDPDVFRQLKQTDKNRLPKSFINDMFGNQWQKRNIDSF